MTDFRPTEPRLTWRCSLCPWSAEIAAPYRDTCNQHWERAAEAHALASPDCVEQWGDRGVRVQDPARPWGAP